jgi:hypothetical protein
MNQPTGNISDSNQLRLNSNFAGVFLEVLRGYPLNINTPTESTAILNSILQNGVFSKNTQNLKIQELARNMQILAEK